RRDRRPAAVAAAVDLRPLRARALRGARLRAGPAPPGGPRRAHRAVAGGGARPARPRAASPAPAAAPPPPPPPRRLLAGRRRAPPPGGVFAPPPRARPAMGLWTRAGAREYGARGLRPFCVAPGFMPPSLTDAWPPVLRDAIAAGGATAPEAVARRIRELVEDE